jgi:hypothetical protein
MSHPYEGKIVTLPENFTAWKNGEEIKVSGAYELVEFCPYEPSAYVWSDSWVAVPEDTPDGTAESWEAAEITLDADDVRRVMDPEGYKRNLEQEKAAEEAQIRAELEWE